MPTALLVFAHADDEAIAIGGRIGRFAKDFCNPPHEPAVLYDGCTWGMSSARFCELAREAEHELRDQSANPKLEVRTCP